MEEKMEGVVGALAFNPTPEHELEFDEKTKVAKRIMTPEEFANAFLVDRVVNQNVRNRMRNQGMDR